MPNQALKNNNYNTKGVEKPSENFETLSMQLSRLNKAEEQAKDSGDWSEFKRLGGSGKQKKLDNLISKEQDANYNAKKIGMDAGRENQFLDTHTKDNDNANPTAVGGMPKYNKNANPDTRTSSINKQIMTNKAVYNEEISKEISDIRYLIEYMNNNKQKI